MTATLRALPSRVREVDEPETLATRFLEATFSEIVGSVVLTELSVKTTGDTIFADV